MEKLGLYNTQFPVWLDELDSKPSTVYEMDHVSYMGKKCIVITRPIRIGGRKQCILQIDTNDPNEFIPVYNTSDTHFTSEKGIVIKRHNNTRISEEEMLRMKYSNYDLPKNFEFEELKELDHYVTKILQ